MFCAAEQPLKFLRREFVLNLKPSFSPSQVSSAHTHTHKHKQTQSKSHLLTRGKTNVKTIKISFPQTHMGSYRWPFPASILFFRLFNTVLNPVAVYCLQTQISNVGSDHNHRPQFPLGSPMIVGPHPSIQHAGLSTGTESNPAKGKVETQVLRQRGYHEEGLSGVNVFNKFQNTLATLS